MKALFVGFYRHENFDFLLLFDTYFLENANLARLEGLVAMTYYRAQRCMY